MTARGWEDFSELLYVYEEMQNPVTTDVVYEYLRHPDIAQDVAAYIELYRKYQDDYGIEKILQRKVPASVYERIYRAAFDPKVRYSMSFCLAHLPPYCDSLLRKHTG